MHGTKTQRPQTNVNKNYAALDDIQTRGNNVVAGRVKKE